MVSIRVKSQLRYIGIFLFALINLSIRPEALGFNGSALARSFEQKGIFLSLERFRDEIHDFFSMHRDADGVLKLDEADRAYSFLVYRDPQSGRTLPVFFRSLGMNHTQTHRLLQSAFPEMEFRTSGVALFAPAGNGVRAEMISRGTDSVDFAHNAASDLGDFVSELVNADLSPLDQPIVTLWWNESRPTSLSPSKLISKYQGSESACVVPLISESNSANRPRP